MKKQRIPRKLKKRLKKKFNIKGKVRLFEKGWRKIEKMYIPKVNHFFEFTTPEGLRCFFKSLEQFNEPEFERMPPRDPYYFKALEDEEIKQIFNGPKNNQDRPKE